MTVSNFNRRMHALNKTACKLADVSTHGMTNSQAERHEAKVERNAESLLNLITVAGEEVYNDSDAPCELCATYQDWVW